MAKSVIDKTYIKTQIENFKKKVLDVEYIDKNTAKGYIKNLANRVATLEENDTQSGSSTIINEGKIDNIKVNNETLPIENKTVNITIPTSPKDLGIIFDENTLSFENNKLSVKSNQTQLITGDVDVVDFSLQLTNSFDIGANIFYQLGVKDGLELNFVSPQDTSKLALYYVCFTTVNSAPIAPIFKLDGAEIQIDKGITEFGANKTYEVCYNLQSKQLIVN